MNTLSIDLGVKEYTLNEACTVRFNPTDAGFLSKVYDAFETLAKAQAEYEKTLPELEDAKAVLALMRSKDQAMREILDNVFDVPVCDALFDDMNVFALSSVGLPVWSNLLLAVIDECESDARAKRGKTSATVEKYMKKYHR